MTTMTRTKTFKPNFQKAEKKALEFIRLLPRKELPIKLMGYKDIFANLEIKKYSWYAKKMGLTIEDVCLHLGSKDGCCVYDTSTKKYRIYYNDTEPNEGRKRWTIAHELGHFALRHHETNGVNILLRNQNNTRDKHYDILETEANCFARNLLAPPPVIFHLPELAPYLVEKVCAVSSEAAKYICSFLQRGIQIHNVRYAPDSFERLGFGKFMKTIQNQYVCQNCEIYFVATEPANCPGCGNHKIKKTIVKQGDDFDMKYSGIKVDRYSRVLQCLICENSELDFDGDHCNICASVLVNKCASFFNKNSCGTLLMGNSRYCHKCGNPSTFLQSEYLIEWEEEKQKN